MLRKRHIYKGNMFLVSLLLPSNGGCLVLWDKLQKSPQHQLKKSCFLRESRFACLYICWLADAKINGQIIFPGLGECLAKESLASEEFMSLSDLCLGRGRPTGQWLSRSGKRFLYVSAERGFW